MKFSLLTLILFVLTFMSPDSSTGYRILCVFPVQIKSHFMMFEALMKGLARKGHQVDVVGNLPLEKPYPNYTDVAVLPLSSKTLTNALTYDFLYANINDMTRYIATQIGNDLCKYLGHPEMLKIIKHPPTDPPYDLVMTQVLATSCYMALGHHLKVPVVGVSASALYPWNNRYVANPPNLAFAPCSLINTVAPMNFWERLHNTIQVVYSDVHFQYLTRPQTDIIKKYLGEDALSVREAESSLALVLVNTHPSINGPKPVAPAVIEVGGLHLEDDDHELSQDLKDWMANSTDGFIYFSFGSMLMIETFPEKMIQAIYQSFGKIAPLRVLIRISNPERLPPGMPKNFRTIKWAPQLQVLKHKNIKAFVTHGGLLGTQEAIHSAVPMIGFPFMADQLVNIGQYSKMKIAVRLQSFTEEGMDAALNEILYNPVYRDTMKKVSARFRDRPMSALNTAIWWVEYAVRHESSALRSPAMDLYWWQIQLLDVYVFILLSVMLIVYITITFVRFLTKKFLIAIRFRIWPRKKVE